MQKSNMYKVLSIVAYIVSGCTSLIFLVGFGVSFIDKALAWMLTILFEPTKPILFIQIFKKHQQVIKSTIIVTWIVIEIASIVASTSYMMNMTNKSIETSPGYVALKKKETKLNETIEADKKSLATATSALSGAIKADSNAQSDVTKQIATYNSSIKTLQNRISSKNSQLQTAINKNSKTPMTRTMARLRAEIKGLNTELANATAARKNASAGGTSVASTKAIISELNTNIRDNTTLLNKIDYSNIKSDITTSGYMAFFIPVGKLIGFDPTLLSLIFFLVIFGIVPELIGNLCFYLHKKEESTLYETELQYSTSSPPSQNLHGNNDTAFANASSDYVKPMDNNMVGSHSFIPNADSKVDPPPVKVIRGFVPETKPTSSLPREIHDAAIFYAIQALSTFHDGNICEGLTTMHKRTDYKRDLLGKGKNYLEMIGALYVKGTTTYIQNFDLLKEASAGRLQAE